MFVKVKQLSGVFVIGCRTGFVSDYHPRNQDTSILFLLALVLFLFAVSVTGFPKENSTNVDYTFRLWSPAVAKQWINDDIVQ
jgi:uncharacterized membrane protein